MTIHFIDIASWIFSNSIKASILILIILAIQVIFRNRLSAKWHYAFWFLLVIRLLIPPSLESSFSLYNLIALFQSLTGSGPASQTVNAFGVHPVATVMQMPVIMAEAGREVTREAFLSMIWCLGVFIITLIAIIGNFKLWLKVKHRTPVTDKTILDIFGQSKEQMKVRAKVRLCQVEGIAMPMLYGLFRPAVLIPSRQVNQLTEQQYRHVFCHELAHHKRCDILLAHVTTLLQILHWFNPLMWIVFYKIRIDREIACDGMALDHLGRDEARAYGHTIIAMLEQIVSDNLLPLTVGVVESKHHLKKRLSMIARFRKRSVVWSIAAMILMSVVGCAALTEAKKQNEPPNHSIIMKMDFQEPYSKISFKGEKVEINTGKNGKKYCKAKELTLSNIQVEGDPAKQITLTGEKIGLTQIDSVTWKIEADRLKIDTVQTGTDLESNHYDRRPVIVIDPGHGGRDPGAVAQNGVNEKEMNLLYGKLLAKYLDRAGFHVVLSREDDRFLSLPDRADLTKENNAILLMSIHMNNNRDEAKSGQTIWYSDSHPFSYHFANHLKDSLVQKMDIKDISVYKANFSILRLPTCPSVIVEPGYLSNRNDLAELVNPAYQEQVTRTITNSIVTFYKRLNDGTGFPNDEPGAVGLSSPAN